MHFENPRDFNMRLSGTVIRLGKTPITVRDSEDVWMNFKYLRSGRQGRVDIEDERINITPVTLGYYNSYASRRSPAGCFYLTRKPGRRYKQGLDYNSLHRVGMPIGSRFTPHLRNLADTIQGRYPSLSECIDLLREGEYVQRAFHRDFSLCGHDTIEVGYKGRFIGVFNDDEVELYDGCDWVQESLEEVLDVCA